MFLYQMPHEIVKYTKFISCLPSLLTTKLILNLRISANLDKKEELSANGYTLIEEIA